VGDRQGPSTHTGCPGGGRLWQPGRVKKQKCTFESGQELQKAAVHLLSCHQNLNDLLLEVRQLAVLNFPVISWDYNSGVVGSQSSAQPRILSHC
uniref:Uncharacterized protein n=1 Tax=Chelonoidis abingdonii TaxID=106734 RepID=A0A8C0H7V8_CHEAB